MRRIRIILVLALVSLAGGAAAWFLLPRDPRAGQAAMASIEPGAMRIVPDSIRVKIEVLNASGQRGLARRATHYLRDRGFDVVSVGNAPEQRDSSLVLDRSGHADWAAWAAQALGGARIEARPDSTRYLDLTLVIGRSFRVPSQILYP